MPHGLSLADFRAVLFDLDGTLVDTLPALIRGLGDSYEKFNGSRPSDREIRETIGLPLRKQMQMFTSAPASEINLSERIEATVRGYQKYASLEREFEPAIEALRLIKKAGFKTALVTSKCRLELDLFAERTSWLSDFDAMVCADDVKSPKPAAESVLLACELLQAQRDETLFIGDSIFDLQCGKSAGVRVAAAGYGSGNKQALLSENPDLFFNSPEELRQWAEETIYTPYASQEKTRIT